MFRRLYRQRRRIMLFMVLFSAAFTLLSVGDSEFRFVIKTRMSGQTGLFLAIAAGLLIVGSGLFAALVVALVPAYRRALEAAGIAMVLQAVLERWIMGPSSWGENGVWMWVSFFVIFYAVSFALERDAFRKAGLKMTYRARARRSVAATQAALWATMAPTRETMGSYWTKSLTRVDARPDLGPDTHEVHFRLGPHGFLVQRHDRGTWNWPNEFNYAYGPVEDGPARMPARGTYRVTLTPGQDDWTVVQLEHHIVELGFGTWLLLWLDDTAQSELDAVAAAISGKADWSIAGWQARQMARA
jgi:hypothetical protein